MGDVCSTVSARWGTGGGNVPLVNFFNRQRSDSYGDTPLASTVTARDHKEFTDLVAYSIREDAKANTFSATELEVANAIGALWPSVQSHHAQTFITSNAVRRLTPIECERLQGFKDGFTNIPWRGKPESPDGLRYKALGNSMAVNVMSWIGSRIEERSSQRA